MAGQESDDARKLTAVKFSRLARRGLLLGLDLAQVTVIEVGLATSGDAPEGETVSWTLIVCSGPGAFRR